MRGLVILDLNGIISLSHDRPQTNLYAINFVKSLQTKYDVAVWTSTTFRNAQSPIAECFKNSTPAVFEWYRDKTDPDPEIGFNPYATIKNISKVRQEFPQYENILIVDDNFYKIRFNPDDEILVCESKPRSIVDYYLFYYKLEVNIDLKMKILLSK